MESLFRYRSLFVEDSLFTQESASVPTVTSASEALAVDLAGDASVVTLAQRTLALRRSPSFVTHGVDVLDEEVVETEPVSGVGFTSMNLLRNDVTEADSP
jgi:hypothetical protein